eukprot:TRINITY_DN9311_c0_g5_i1.p1 TRINITY_DN9311_c0_g5~~TRINITY_DN9311_c0_g5_i1.p1  ORF type:complete len:276 (-),score=53.48 TRINITY_DN9311_c0_g5_i1:50-877(-)
MTSIFNDLLFLLKKFKEKGSDVFHEVKRSSQFKVIEMEIASVRNPGFFIKSKSKEKLTYWLERDEEKLSFFLNLYNFLILFGLCKYGGLYFPKTQLEWSSFANLVALKVGDNIYSAAEIEHGILRAVMANPNIPSASLEGAPVYPKFGELDTRRSFAYKKKEPLLCFALYRPTISSPSLRVYVPKKVKAQMKNNCARYLDKTIKLTKDKSTLVLPSLLDWYSEDFTKSKTTTNYVFFLQGHLSKDSLRQIKSFEQKYVRFAEYNWGFMFDYVEDK